MKQTTLRLNAKTFTLLLLSVLFSLVLAVPAFAAEAIYIPKLEMYITMPDDWIVFNEPLDENDSIFEDWDYDYIVNYMDEQNAPCIATSNNLEYEINVIAVSGNAEFYNIKDLEKYLSDNQIKEIFKTLDNEDLDLPESAEILNFDIKNTESAKYSYFEIYYPDNENTDSPNYIVLYLTYVNGNTIDIVLRTDEYPDDHLKNIFSSVINSVAFKEIKETPQSYWDSYENDYHLDTLGDDSLSDDYLSDIPIDDIISTRTLVMVIIGIIIAVLIIIFICKAAVKGTKIPKTPNSPTDTPNNTHITDRTATAPAPADNPNAPPTAGNATPDPAEPNNTDNLNNTLPLSDTIHATVSLAKENTDQTTAAAEDSIDNPTAPTDTANNTNNTNILTDTAEITTVFNKKSDDLSARETAQNYEDLPRENPNKSNNPFHYFIRGMKNYANFKGRACRKEYWMFGITLLVLFRLLEVADAHLGSGFANPLFVDASLTNWLGAEYLGILSTTFFLITFIPHLAIMVRRLHDFNMPWVLLFCFLLPFINILFALLLVFKNSMPGPNHYGQNPKEYLNDEQHNTTN